jgi:hypothetical protein
MVRIWQRYYGAKTTSGGELRESTRCPMGLYETACQGEEAVVAFAGNWSKCDV